MKHIVKVLVLLVASALMLSIPALGSWNFYPETMGSDVGIPIWAITNHGDKLDIENVGNTAGILSGAKVVRIAGNHAELVADLPQVCVLQPNPAAATQPPIVGPELIRSFYKTMVTVPTLVPIYAGDTLMITNGAGVYAIQKIS